ncbi:hypothetical protein ABRP83_13545 [Pectobacterium brasiliense]|uniref:hypothetical protein n=1 Tax=Pectobacterium brasiliense TaxID=180957 RepID=UPI0032ECD798
MIDDKRKRLRELARIGSIVDCITAGRTRPLERMPFFISLLIFPFASVLVSTFYEAFSNYSLLHLLIIHLMFILLAIVVYFIVNGLVKDRETWVNKLFFILGNYEPVDKEKFIELQNEIRNSVENDIAIDYKKILKWQFHEVELLVPPVKKTNEINVDKFLSKRL